MLTPFALSLHSCQEPPPLTKKRRKASTTPSDEVDKTNAEADKLKAAAEAAKGGDDVPTTPPDNVSDYNNMSLEEQVLSLIRILSYIDICFWF